jgi:hypothetical protein
VREARGARVGIVDQDRAAATAAAAVVLVAGGVPFRIRAGEERAGGVVDLGGDELRAARAQRPDVGDDPALAVEALDARSLREGGQSIRLAAVPVVLLEGQVRRAGLGAAGRAGADLAPARVPERVGAARAIDLERRGRVALGADEARGERAARVAAGVEERNAREDEAIPVVGQAAALAAEPAAASRSCPRRPRRTSAATR